MSRDGDYETEQIGLRFLHHLAPVALNFILRQRRAEAICDGFPSRGDSAGRGTSDSSLTEAAVLRADEIRADLQKMFDLRAACKQAQDAYADFLLRQPEERIPVAIDVPRCRDEQKFGGIDALLWSDDMECPELPSKLKLCAKHYSQYYRYRKAKGISTAHHFEPA